MMPPRDDARRLAEILAAVPDAMIVCAHDGRIVAANAQADALFGYEAGELPGLSVEALMPESHRAAHRGHRTQYERAPRVRRMGASRALPARRKDGSLFPAEVSLGPAEVDGGAGAICAVRDATDRLKIDERLCQAQKMEALGRFSGGVAHDFNNVLSTILGLCDLIEQEAHDASAVARDIADVRAAGRRAADLTRQLLTLTRRQVLRPRVVDLSAALAGMERTLRRLLGERVEFVLSADPGAGRVRVDPSQLEQVVLNLVSNARDALPDGGTLTVETRAHPLPEGGGAGAVLRVRDTGAGMAPETVSRLFEPFFTTKPRGQGSGLGLSTVHGIVAQCGGSITVDSRPGGGTTFSVHFPRVEEPVSAPEEAAPVVPLAGRETVLVVDDEASIVRLASRLLVEKGYVALNASDAADAVALAQSRRQPIDLLLVDVVMPKMNGVELAARVSQSHPETRTLYMSGYLGGESTLVELDRDAAFLPKPFSAAELLRAVRLALDRR